MGNAYFDLFLCTWWLQIGYASVLFDDCVQGTFAGVARNATRDNIIVLPVSLKINPACVR